jgi:hypothetical protein
MAAPGGSHVPSEARAWDVASFRKQGALAGIFGAALVAAWFLYLDALRGKLLFTPTLLATALLRGSQAITAPETLHGSIPLTLFFTAVHGLMFILIGVGAAELLHRFASVRSRALIILLLFGVLCVAFFAFASNISALGPQTVAVRDALVANAIGAFGMGAYLARNLPAHSP